MQIDSIAPLSPRASLSVSQLNRRVAQLLEAQIGRVWVEGEISNFTAAASGHWYFSIKDERAAIKAVMFRGRASRLGFMPKLGEKYRFYAAISMYEPRGDLQLQVEDMERAGLGDLYAEFERLKQRLAAEGLFETSRKLTPVAVPKTIGVVTSLAAAALHDVLTTMRRRAPHVEIYVYPAAVQGIEAAEQLCCALGQAIADNKVQTILLVRGGGSIEDLWSFNSEHLARLIYASHIPIISGVGHETDVTIADFVADVRAPTPTAAAELCCVSWAQSNAELIGVLRRLHSSQVRIHERASLRLDRTVARLISPQQRLAQMKQQLAATMQRLYRIGQITTYAQVLYHLVHRLELNQPQTQKQQLRLQEIRARLLQSIRQRLKQYNQYLYQCRQTLNALSPEAVLERGYAIVRTENNHIVRRSTEVDINDQLHLQLAQGHLIVKLKQKHDLL